MKKNDTKILANTKQELQPIIVTSYPSSQLAIGWGYVSVIGGPIAIYLHVLYVCLIDNHTTRPICIYC